MSEQAPISQREIAEKPAAFSVEEMVEVFALDDVQKAAIYQTNLADQPQELVDHPLPEEFVDKYRYLTPMLTYNTNNYYSDSIQGAFTEDLVLQRLAKHKIGRA